MSKRPSPKVPILISFPGGKISDVGIVGSCVEENTRRQKHGYQEVDAPHEEERNGRVHQSSGPPSSFVFALTNDGRTLGWDTESGDPSHETRACLPGKRLSAIAMHSHMGKTLMYFGTEDGQCRALDVDNCQCETVFKPHPPTSRLKTTTKNSSHSLGCIVTMSAQDGVLATGNSKGQTCIWDVATGRLKRRWNSHKEQAITSIRFDSNEPAADFRTVYTTARDRSVRVWDIRLKNPQVKCWTTHRNTPRDVCVLDSVVYSCAETASQKQQEKSSEIPLKTSVVLPSLNSLEKQLSTNRLFPPNSRINMRDVVRQRLKRLPLWSSALEEQHSRDTKSNTFHPLQKSMLAMMPKSTNGIRPAGEFLVVHDMRSQAVLRELNIVDSSTGLRNISNATLFCSPAKGRRTVLLAGGTAGGRTKACCVSIDTGEMLYDLEMLPTEASCTSLACTKSTSSASQIAMGWADGSFAAWNLDSLSASAEQQNTPWREMQLAGAFQQIDNAAGASQREETLHKLLNDVRKLRSECKLSEASRWSWSTWQDVLNEMIGLSQEAIDVCSKSRSKLSSRELEFGTLTAATAGMIPDAIRLMNMHVRTGISTSDQLAASIMGLLPFEYHFGHGKECVPKVSPMLTIGRESAILIGEKCIQTIKASGRIPREDATAGFIQLLCRCGYIHRALEELAISRSRGLKPGRKVYQALLQALLSSGAKLEEMTNLMNEMMKYNIAPSESEFQMLTDANIVDKRYVAARDWMYKMIDAGCSPEMGRQVALRLLNARIVEHVDGHKERQATLTAKERRAADNEVMSFVVNIVKDCTDLKYILIRILLIIHRDKDAYRLLLKLEHGETVPSNPDINQLVDYVSKNLTPQPEVSISFFEHICWVGGGDVDGSTHAAYMRALLRAHRVDLALKHFTKLEKAGGDVAAVLPAPVYNALLSAFEASDDLIGLKTTWGKMIILGNYDARSYELMMEHYLRVNDQEKTVALYEEFKTTGLEVTPNIVSFVLSVQTDFQNLQLVFGRHAAAKFWIKSITAAISTSTKIAMSAVHRGGFQNAANGPSVILRWAAQVFLAFHQSQMEAQSAQSTATKTINTTKVSLPSLPSLPVNDTEQQFENDDGNIEKDDKAYQESISSLINGLCHDKIREAILAQTLLEVLTNPPPQCYGALIDCLLTTGERERADKVVSKLLIANLTGNGITEAKVETGNTVQRKSNAMSGKILRAEEAEIRKRKERLAQAANTSDILENVIIGLSNGGRVEAALRVACRCMDRGFAMSQKGIWHSMLQGAVSNPQLGSKIWMAMKKSSILIDDAAWTAYIRTKGADSKAALLVLRQMGAQRIVATTDNCSAILEACVAGSNPEGTTMMLKVMHTRSMQIKPAVFCRMIQAAVHDQTQAALEQGIDILQFMRSSGGRPDLLTCQAIFNATAKLGDATSAILLMLQIKDSNESNKKKETPSTAALGSNSRGVRLNNDLCLSYVRSLARGHELATALSFVRLEMCSEGSGVIAGTAVWSTLLEGAARSRDVGKAEEIQGEMQRRGVMPNRMGRRALVLLYSKANKIERALATIAVNKEETEIEWPGLKGAKQIILACCRRLDSVTSKVTTKIALEQICMVFRSTPRNAGRQKMLDLIDIVCTAPASLRARLGVLREPPRRGWGAEDSECLPLIEEMESYLH